MYNLNFEKFNMISLFPQMFKFRKKTRKSCKHTNTTRQMVDFFSLQLCFKNIILSLYFRQMYFYLLALYEVCYIDKF